MENALDVLVVGDYCLDLIFTGMKSEPILGKEIVATGFNMTLGGTCNSALAMHRLGLKVAWAADFGADQFSQFVLEKLNKENFDSRYFIQHKKAMRLLTVSLSYPHERAFIAYYDKTPILPAAFSVIPKVESKWVYIPGLLHGPQLEAGLSLMRRKKMKIAMDGNFWERLSLKTKAVRRAIEICELFFSNADEARSLTGEKDLKKALITLGKICPVVAVKAGSLGAYGVQNQTVEYVPAIKVKSIDTTGAGDCFNAGFIKAFCDGNSLRECLKWGNIVGGLSTLGLGGVDRVTTVLDVVQWLKKYKD
jgi:sugar/nucleoside kinase (ribokinase family)